MEKIKLLRKAYTLSYKQYGEITIPKGTLVVDTGYRLEIGSLDWVYDSYPAYANILKRSIEEDGIEIPKELIEEINVEHEL